MCGLLVLLATNVRAGEPETSEPPGVGPAPSQPESDKPAPSEQPPPTNSDNDEPSTSAPSEPVDPEVAEPSDSAPSDAAASSVPAESPPPKDQPVPPEAELPFDDEEDPSVAEENWIIESDLSVGEVDLADPLGPIEAVLDELDSRDEITVNQRARTVDRLRGETLTAVLSNIDGGLLQYMLERVAEDGYQVLLEPLGDRTFMLIALRSRPGQARGVLLVGVEKLELQGQAREGESTDMLRKLLVVPAGGVLPIGITEQLGAVGYRATIDASGPGTIAIRIQPGRMIRRVRIRGHLPLPVREIRRALSPAARPGALAPGVCRSPKEVRKRPTQVAPTDIRGGRKDEASGSRRSGLCEKGDLACLEWERTEISRLQRYMFDNGYLKGGASLALACGRGGDEVDLHVVLRKGPAYRVGKMTVTGNLTTKGQRWIRRVFRPTMSPIFPLPRRVTRKHIEQAKERVAREYAEPATGPGATRRELQLPYPGVRVDTNFDRIEREDLPPGRRLPLKIDVQLGQGVSTKFVRNNHITKNRLRGQLKLFKQREPANAATARREAAQLRGYYQSRGFMLARVDGRFDEFGSRLPALVFNISEGPRVTVRRADLKVLSNLPPVVGSAVRRAYSRNRQVEKRSRFTDSNARDDLGHILTALNERGYLCARAWMRVSFWPEGLNVEGQHAVFDALTDLDAQGAPTWLESQLDEAGLAALRAQPRAGLYVRIEVQPGPRVVTSNNEQIRYLEEPIPGSRQTQGLPFAEQGAWSERRMLRKGPLRRPDTDTPGDVPIFLTLDRDIERDIVRRYRASGYPIADAEVRWSYTDRDGVVHSVSQADRLASPEVGLCSEQARQPGAPVDVEIGVYEGRMGRFGTTLVRGNFKTNRRVLTREQTWKEGDTYDRRRVDETRRHIEGIAVTEGVQVREQEVGCHLADDEDQCVVHHVVSITESKDRALDVEGGFGGATLDPLYVFLRPTLPNMLGTGWDLQLDGHYGFGNVFQTFCDGENCYERSGRASLVRRRIFASPFTFEITGQVQQRVTPARGEIDSALGQVRLTLPIGDHWRAYAGYLVQVANVSKDVVKPILGNDEGCTQANSDLCRPPNRGEAIVPDRTGAVMGGAVWQRVDNSFNPNEGFILTLDGLFATPSLGHDWWARADVGWQHFVPIPKTNNRLNFRYSLRYGHAFTLPVLPGSQTSIPEVWRYFGGGTTDLGIRGIEPQTMLVDIEAIEGPFGTQRLSPTAQGGHIRALGTVALQVVSVSNFLGGKLAHSAFVDLGVLTQDWGQVQLRRDLRRSAGLNFIKWDIRIVTVSVGYAVLIPDSIWPGGNVRPTDDRNGRFVFDVGATF